VHGIEPDPYTRCTHYSSTLDIVAIKFRCCLAYYCCFYCHQAETRHPADTWARDQFDEKAVLCGVCGGELTIREYLDCHAVCPQCGSAFNPRCESHYPLYFEI
jgi:uncharacterized CHY-type Zn-finger protein